MLQGLPKFIEIDLENIISGKNSDVVYESLQLQKEILARDSHATKLKGSEIVSENTHIDQEPKEKRGPCL